MRGKGWAVEEEIGPHRPGSNAVGFGGIPIDKKSRGQAEQTVQRAIDLGSISSIRLAPMGLPRRRSERS